MRCNITGLALLLVLGTLACGGEVRRSGRDTGSSNSQASSPNQDDPMSSSFGEADTAVGDCVPGPPEEEALYGPCMWVADGRCYQEREMACNCVCPRDRDSQCSSGFDAGPNGHVKVSCR